MVDDKFRLAAMQCSAWGLRFPLLLHTGTLDTAPLDLFLDHYAEFSLLPGGTKAEVHLTGYYRCVCCVLQPTLTEFQLVCFLKQLLLTAMPYCMEVFWNKKASVH
jgi:hypothetical protein